MTWQTTGQPHIWHPYTQMQTAPEPLVVTKTEGVHIHLKGGKKLIDGLSSWWSACHGYNHPHIREAVAKQLEIMPHVMFAGPAPVAHEQAYTLATRLAAMAPSGLERVFFVDSGSVAVEAAMKMAVQYWYNKGEKKRQKFVAFRGGYHGDTMGAMSLCDPEEGMHKKFSHYMPMQYVMDIPADEYAFAEFEEILDGVKHTIAGVIIEPLVQGAGGMRFHSADTLAEIYKITKRLGTLFIADEIMTGFGRTGLMFASQEAGITPDIMCVGKGLTGGTCSLAATLATEEVYNAFLSDDLNHAFMHGPTFMANPLACAAANASLDLFEQEPRLEQVQAIETQMWGALKPCAEVSSVVDVRVRGAIAAVQLQGVAWKDMFAFRKAFLDKGVWLRPFADVIYLMPPFTISEKELRHLTDAVVEVVQAIP
jgi:adenosylmethionine-8-amino-7-oxononanoate aminotransferase